MNSVHDTYPDMCGAAVGGLSRGPVRRAVDYVLSLLPVVLAGCLFLSLLASIFVLGLKVTTTPFSSWAGGVFLYIGIFVILAWLLKTAKGVPERYVIWGLIGLSVVIKLALVAFTLNLPLHADQELFHYFVREMSDHRLQSGTLSALSSIYDYPVWAGRVLPFHYLVRYIAGPYDILGIRLLNIGVSTAILLLTYGFACRLLPEGRRKWAVFLMVLLPFQSFLVTDYTHHLFSSFYFLLFTWCVWEMFFTSPRPIRRIFLAVLTGGCLLLMMWQRGVHLLALAILGMMLAWAAGVGFGWKRWGVICISIGVIPLILSLPLASRYDQWLDRHDTHQLNSILPAFVARGWCPESAGEYCGRYEQLDRVTPWPGKKTAMYRLVLSQIRYNPLAVCVRFPILKTAKLFLVGYASNFEEALFQTGSAALPWARGMRLAATPIFLGLAIWGCLGLSVRSSKQALWLPILLAPVLTWGAYVFLGETSPRYSVFCQPFLGLLGALALANFEGDGRKALAVSGSAWRGIAIRGAVILSGIVLVLGLLVLVVRMIPVHQLYADLQHGWISGNGEGTSSTVQAGEFQPFEARISLPPEVLSTQVSWMLPSPSPVDSKGSIYLLGVHGAIGSGSFSIGTAQEVLWTHPLADFSGPLYLELDLPAGTEGLTFTLEGSAGNIPGNSSVEIGYLSFEERGGAE